MTTDVVRIQTLGRNNLGHKLIGEDLLSDFFLNLNLWPPATLNSGRSRKVPANYGHDC